MEILEESEGQLYTYPGKVKSYVWAHFGFHKSINDGKLDLTIAVSRECKKKNLRIMVRAKVFFQS